MIEVPKPPTGSVESSRSTLSGWTLSEITPDRIRLSFDPLKGPFKAKEIHPTVVLTRQQLETIVSRMQQARPTPLASDL